MQTGRQDHTCPPAFPYIARILTARVREEGEEERHDRKHRARMASHG
jgi:hypothetical protein